MNLDELAESLGYEQITWDAKNVCYSGYGSSDPMDRSKDKLGGMYVAADENELQTIYDRLVSWDGRLVS